MTTELLLTARELEILKLIADGLTNEDIALALSLSRSTVNTHRKNILRKLQLKNTALLIRWACKQGLID